MKDVREVLDDFCGRARTVLEYSQVMKRFVDGAKQTNDPARSLDPLADLVAIDEFERLGNFKEVMDWPEYVDFLTSWASSADWECSFKRLTESGDLVFLELEERSRMGDFTSVVNSLSVFEFNAVDKIRHIDIYLQMALPGSDLPTGYEGVRIAQ